MKKLLLCVTILAFISCSDDDSSSNDCNCDAVFVEGLSENPTYVGTYEDVELNCSTGEAKYNPTGNPNAYFSHCEEN